MRRSVRLGLACGVVAALLVGVPALAQELASDEEPPLAVEPLVEPEVEPALYEEALQEEDPPPFGYSDASGTLNSLEESDGLRASVRGGTLRAERAFTPLEVTLQNMDPVPRQVHLSVRGYGSGGAVTTRTLAMAPGQRLTTHLLLPSEIRGGMLTVEGPDIRPRVTGVYLDEVTALSTLVLGTSKAFEASTRIPRAEENRAPLINARFLSAQDAPREFAAYVGYDAVVVTEEATAVPSDVWAALEHYAAVGGTLLFVRPPRDIRQRLPMLEASLPAQQWSPYGFGKVFLCEEAARCGQALGAVRADTRPTLIPVGPPPRWDRSRSALSGGETPLLPNALAPVGRFLVLIFFFTLVVGPGGLILARRKGPVALLIGVPAVAGVTCLLIVGDSLIGDGFVTHASRYSYTFLDRHRDRAITSAVAGYYANLASKSVQIPSMGVLLAPEELSEWEVDVEWAGGGMVAEGFLPARTYLEWAELAVVPTRARLVARREGTTLRVQNALGAPLHSGRIHLDGTWYTLPPLADGAEGAASEMLALPKSQEEDFVDPPRHMERRTRDLEAFVRRLPEGGFLVRLEGRGFAPLSALTVELHEGIHYVRGEVDRL